MNCFQLIKTVLDEIYEEIPGTEAEKDEAIAISLEELRKQYRDIKSHDNISYSNPSTRFAYLYRYTTSHANLVSTCIEKSQHLEDLFKREPFKITSLGGGPGSDLLGVIKYCDMNKISPNVKFYILDKENSWSDSWSDVDTKLNKQISASYQIFDVTAGDSSLKKHLESDLFTLIYFMSEIYSRKKSAVQYMRKLFSEAKENSVILFIDNNDSHIYDWFNTLASENHDIVFNRDSKISLPTEEEKKDLGKYYTKFPSPKITADVSIRIAVKK